MFFVLRGSSHRAHKSSKPFELAAPPFYHLLFLPVYCECQRDHSIKNWPSLSLFNLEVVVAMYSCRKLVRLLLFIMMRSCLLMNIIRYRHYRSLFEESSSTKITMHVRVLRCAVVNNSASNGLGSI